MVVASGHFSSHILLLTQNALTSLNLTHKMYAYTRSRIQHTARKTRTSQRASCGRPPWPSLHLAHHQAPAKMPCCTPWPWCLAASCIGTQTPAGVARYMSCILFIADHVMMWWIIQSWTRFRNWRLIGSPHRGCLASCPLAF